MKHAAPLAGDNGAFDRIPLLGEFQVLWGRLRNALRRPDTAIKIYAAFLSAIAGALAIALGAAGEGLGAPIWVIALLSLFALAAEQQPVRLSSSSEVTVSVLPVLFAAVAFGPLAAMIIAAAGLLGDARRPFARWAIWTSARTLAGGLAGAGALMVGIGARSLGDIAAAVLVAFSVDAIVDLGLASATIGIRGVGCWKTFVRSSAPITAVTVPLYTPVLIMLVYAYSEISVWTILLFFAPAFAAHSLYRLYREQRHITNELKAANESLERANLSFAGALVAALDARDRYTAGHSASVAVFARDIAAELDLSPRERELAHVCGLVHDIGKVGLPPGVLEKPGPLTEDERRIMEQHSEIGERILSNVEGYTEIAKIVRHHHERLDGSGYPDALSAEAIPLISRILSVADAYDAMISARPYRDAMAREVALSRLEGAAGSQFDPIIVRAFECVLAKGRVTAPAPASRISFSQDMASAEMLLAKTA